MDTLIKCFNLDIVFEVLTKCTNCFVQCSGPTAPGNAIPSALSRDGQAVMGGVKNQLSAGTGGGAGSPVTREL